MSQPSGGVSATPMWNSAKGVWVNSVTGQPYNGADPATGKQYVRGQPTTEPVPYSGGQQINPNDPTQRYSPVNITKSPEIASATSDLLGTFTKTANSALQDFNSYLKNFQNQIGSAAEKTATATDIGPLTQELTANQEAYANALQQASKDYQGLNAQTAAQEHGIVQDAQNLIPAYDQAMTNAEGLQLGNLQQQVNRYKLAPGSVPRGLGSSELRQLAAGTAAVTVPLEQAKIQQRYNILSQYALPTTMDIANRETNRISQFNPAIAAEQFKNGTVTEETIHNLQVQAAQMSYDQALKYMQAIGVPYNLQQQILSGQIGQLGGLSSLYSGSRYQGLQDKLGANITPSIGYNVGTGAYPQAPRYPNTGYPNQSQPNQSQPNLTPGATVGGQPAKNQSPYGQGSPWVADYGNQRWVNKNTGQFSPMQTGDTRFPAQAVPYSPGTTPNYTDYPGVEYDPANYPASQAGY
jgi:hypothetical protein